MTSSFSSSTFRYLHEHQISSSLFCPICLDVLQDPYIHLNCDSAFCQTCLLQIEKPLCPICRHYWGETNSSPNQHYVIKANRLIRNMLDELSVECRQCHIVRRRGDFQHDCQSKIDEENDETNQRKISTLSTRILTFLSTSILIVFLSSIIYYRRWIFLDINDRCSTMINNRAVNLDQFLFNLLGYLIRIWIEYLRSMLILSLLFWFSLRWFKSQSELFSMNKHFYRCLELVIIVQLITYSFFY